MFKILRLIHNRKRDGFTVRLSPPEFMALKFFEENPASTASLFAQNMCIRKPTATILLQKLIFRGLLSKQSNEKDTRSSYIALTEHGKTELCTSEAEFSRFADPVFDVLNPEEKKTLQSLFKKIITQPSSHE